MKTHIIQLEQHDDIISARDKMVWAKGERILLVWPERGRVLYRRLDLILLLRQSLAQGAQLALVTKDPDVRYYAPRLGIPVFKSLRRAQRSVWRLPRRFRGAKPGSPLLPPEPKGRPATALQNPPERDTAQLHPLARLAFFALGVLALLAIAATLLPTATISLTPQTRVQEVTMDVWAGPQVSAVDLSGRVPARWVTVTVEGRDTTPASGTMLLPDRPARGEVVFTNLTDQPITIPEGTVVLSQGESVQRFAVQRKGELPAGPGETVLLPVIAVQPGSQGNLPEGSLIAIEGPLGTQVSVTNPQATYSGSDRKEPTPTAEDRRLLAERLHRTLEQTALEEISKGLAPGSLLITETLTLVENVEEKFRPPEGIPSDQLALSLRLEYQALVVSGEDLNALAQAVFDANLPPGFAPLQGSPHVENLSAPQLSPDSRSADAWQAQWKLHAYRSILAQTPAPRVVRLVLGFEPAKAIQRLQSELALEAPPSIALTPGWWPRLPILPFRVAVRIEGPGDKTEQLISPDQPISFRTGYSR